MSDFCLLRKKWQIDLEAKHLLVSDRIWLSVVTISDNILLLPETVAREVCHKACLNPKEKPYN